MQARTAPPRLRRLTTDSAVSSWAPDGGSRTPSYSANAACMRDSIAGASAAPASRTVIGPNLFNLGTFGVDSTEGTGDGQICVLRDGTVYGLFETAYLCFPG